MFEELLETAVEAAIGAGEIIKKGTKKVNSSEGKDIKLQADLDSERYICKVLDKKGIDILSEEAGFLHVKSDSQLRWIVDPLDGSLNFVRGLPLFCISIALWNGEIPVLGVIYDFNNGDLYTGIVGKGAHCNGKGITVSNIVNKSHAIICTGFPVYSQFDDGTLNDFVTKVQEYKKVRLLGSAALSLSFVARGAADAYIENHIALWDVAAGIAIVLAAGGDARFSFVDRKRYLLNVYCSNGNLI